MLFPKQAKRSISILLLFMSCLFIFQQLNAQDTVVSKNQNDSLPDLSKAYQYYEFNTTDIEHLPFSSLKDFTLVTPSAYYLKGKRMFYYGVEANAGNIFIDGMQIKDADDFPLQSIGKYTFYGDNSPIYLGNALAGYTDIQSKSIEEKLEFNIDAYTDLTKVMQAYTVEFSLGGPVVSKKRRASKKHVPVFFVGGKFSKTNNIDPVWKTNQKLKPEVLSELQENPLQASASGTGTFLNSEFVTANDFTDGGVPDNAGKSSWNSFAKLSIPIGNTFTISAGNYSNINKAEQGSFENSVFNANNNALISNKNFDNYLKINQKIHLNNDLDIGYSIQLQYSNYHQRIESSMHKDRFFDYGYIGKFTTYKTPTYEIGSDSVDGVYHENVWLLNSWDYDTLVTWQAGSVNPDVAAYTNNYYEIYANQKDGHYENFDQIMLGGGLVNGMGSHSVYGLWNNTGRQPATYSENNLERYIGSFLFELNYKSHHIIAGAEYNKDVQRAYTIQPTGLWNLMRGLTNFHLRELDRENPIAVDYFGHVDAIIYLRKFDQESQRAFDKNLRNKLGLATDGLDFILTDSYDAEKNTIDYYDKNGKRHTVGVEENLFSLDLLTPDELLNNGSTYVKYTGYDYKGNKLNGSTSPYSFFEDRTIDAMRPVYYAAYIQDNFSWKNLNVSVGLRIDAYDANRPVLKDKYSLTEIHTVASAKQVLPFEQYIPDNIEDNYYVYVDRYNNPTKILGFRNGDTWYIADGREIKDPSILDAGYGLSPLHVNPEIDNLQHDDWEPDMTFADYKRVLNFLPKINIDYTIKERYCLYLNYNSHTQNPVGINDFRPENYYYFSFMGDHHIIPNPNLKPLRSEMLHLGFKSIINKYLMLDAAYLMNTIDNYYYVDLIAGAYPHNYITVLNDRNRIGTNGFVLSVNFVNPKASGLFAGVNFTKLFPNESDRNYYDVSDFVINTNLGYHFGHGNEYKGSVWGSVKVLQDFTASLFYQFRRGTPYQTKNVNGGDVVRLTPAFNIINLKLRKGFYFNSNTWLDVYILVENLFNIKNSFYVYPKTGSPDNDGFLTDPVWQNMINNQTNPESFRLLYQMKLNNPQNFDIPRIIRFGIKLNI